MPTARVNGVELAYEVQGGGFPLVLAHGYTATKEMWADQLPAFAARYRVVTYDARGHGASEAPQADDPGYTIDTLVDDQRALMEHLGLEQAHVGGLSMGGMIAMRFALAHPRMVRSLILCDTSPGGSAMSGLAQQLRANRPLIEAAVRARGVTATLANLYAARPEAGAVRTLTLAPGVQRHIERLGRMSVEGFLGAGRALADQESVAARLSEISAPVLIITGDRDFMRAPSEAMHAALPHARFVLIRDSFHGTCLWQPEQFTRAVLDFLDDVEAGRPVARRAEL